MKKFIALVLALFMICGLVACAASTTSDAKEQTASTTPTSNSTESAEKKIILGVQQPLSGDNAVAGQIAVNSIKLFVEQANARGGWAGSQIEVVVYDDQSSPEEAVKVANKLIEQDKADVVIASLLSSNVLASAGYLNEAGILTFGIGTSPSWMAEGWEHVFRACHSSDLVLPSIVDKMVEMGMKSVAILKGEDDSSIAGYEPILPMLEANGIEVLETASYTTGDTDFSGQIASMINSNPDCIYMSTQGTILASFMKQLRSFGYDGLVFSKENMTTDQLEVAGNFANGYIFASAYVTYPDADSCDTEILKNMFNDYKEAYGEWPAQDNAFRAWDSLLVLEKGFNDAGTTDTAAVEEAILKISGLETLAGTVDYTDGTREGLHRVNCYAVENGNFYQIDKWIESGASAAYINK